MKTSVITLVAMGILAAAGSTASACEWQKQVMAKAATPPAKEQAATNSATPVDPVLLARMESRQGETTIPTEPAAKE